MSDLVFVDRLNNGEISAIDEKIIDEELKKVGLVVISRGNGDMSYFLEGLCGVDLSNIDVSRIR